MCWLAWVPASASAAQVEGRVFNDFNTNGVFDTDENAGAVDVGVPGLTVSAFTGTDTLAAPPATTDAEGRYSLTLPDTTVRLELAVVRPWWPSRQVDGLRSDVQFVDASSAQTGVDFGVHRPSEWSFDNPDLFWPAQWAGPAVPENENAENWAIRGAPNFEKRPENQVQDWRNLPDRVEVARFGEVGTVFGLAVDQRTGDLYAGAYYKRFAGLQGRRPGRIFKITEQEAGEWDVDEFATLRAGRDRHPRDSEDILDWFEGCETATVEEPGECDTTWNYVGKLGLGSLVIDDANRNLYTVNLRRKTLIRLPLNGGPRESTEIPDPGCEGGSWRPFAAGINRADGNLYVGGVCAAEDSQNRDDLDAVVFRVDNPRSAPSFVEELRVPLNYSRYSPLYAGGTCQVPSNPPPPPPPLTSEWGLCRWNPWPTPELTGGRAPTHREFYGGEDEDPEGQRSNPSFPQLAAIRFAGDGSMILGFRDLIGDMGGSNVPGEIGTGGGPGDGFGAIVHGDLLRAGATSSFTLERGGVVPRGPRLPDLTSQGQFTNPINWRYGAGMGPDGGYFYDPAPMMSEHRGSPHPYMGGTTQIPGFADVVTTAIHEKTNFGNGLLWKRNSTGANSGALENYITPEDTRTGFGKANGLGDLDAYRGLAPVQIGNRLWYDENGNGIQDADEPPVTDTWVELYDCHGHLVDRVRTNEDGEYWFEIDPGRCYTVRVPLDQESLDGWVPTTRFSGANRRTDSNGRPVNGRSVAFVRPHRPGRNNHSYDFGFRRPAPEPPEPPTPPEPPAEPPVRGVVSRSGPLVLSKHVVRRTRSRVGYSVIVRNGGPNLITRVRVCDRLPAGLAFAGGTRPGRSVSGRRVCWRIASLSSGQHRELDLRTRAGAAASGRTMVNCVTAQGIGRRGPNGRGRRVGPVRACARVRGLQPPPVTG